MHDLASPFSDRTGVPIALPPDLIGGRRFRAIAYRSRSTTGGDREALHHLLRSARLRNHAAGISGILAVDHGSFFQWLEGPADAVMALWEIIRADTRHEDVEQLGMFDLPLRLFDQWDMQLGWRQGGAPLDDEGMVVPGSVLNAIHQSSRASPELWQKLQGAAQTDVGWPTFEVPAAGQTIFGLGDTVLPDAGSNGFASSVNVLAELVSCCIRSDLAASDLVASLEQYGLSAETIFLDLFEPPRGLRDLWQEDRCSEADVALALRRLQFMIRRLGESFQFTGRRSLRPRKILIATEPGEPHMLALALSSEFFWRAGWNVTCVFPKSDEELARLLSEQRFDVLDLSLSSVFSREHRLGAIGTTIREARTTSANRALVVLASGRVFTERPEMRILVGADASYRTVSQSVGLADKLTLAINSTEFSLANRAIRNAISIDGMRAGARGPGMRH